MPETLNPYEEENKASIRAHLLFMYGRMKQLAFFEMRGKTYACLSEEGQSKFDSLMESGFKPNRDRLISCLLAESDVPSSHVGLVADMMIDYDWILEELRKDHEENV